MTVSDSHPTTADDSQASLRTDLMGQIVAAQASLEAAIAELSQAGGSPGQLAEGKSQLAMLGALSLQLGTASSAALASLRGEVSAAAASASGTAQQARTAAATAANEASADIARAAATAREQVNNVMRGMKDFDPYLQFGSKAEEEAYRKREAERQAYIAEQQGKNTPQGDLNAANSAIEQMNDAKAHGAARSPVFEDRMAALTKSRDQLRDTIAQSPPENALSEGPTPKAAEKPAQSTKDDLDAAMAALREAGVKPAAASDGIVADTYQAPSENKARSATSGRA